MCTISIWNVILPLLSFASIASSEHSPCPVLGPIYLPPRDLSSQTLWQWASDNLTEAFSSEALQPEHASFAVQITARDSESPVYEYYHKAPDHLVGGNDKTEVDRATVFRIGSVSKMLTVNTLLLICGYRCFEDPITDYVPELRYTYRDAVNQVDWEGVTLGSLAAQLSGISRDYTLGDLGRALIDVPGLNPSDLGFPVLHDNGASMPNCSALPTLPGCDRKESLPLLLQQPPSYAPWQSAAYSNAAFQLLGYAIENMTGKSYTEAMQSFIFDPLNMTQTTVSAPKSTNNSIVIPNDPFFDWNIGDLAAAGSIYTSSADLSKHVHALLNHAQLSPVVTRRWLKPMSHTADYRLDVGAPWEIVRLPGFSDHHIIDVYTKGGNIGTYTAQYGLLPDFEIGYSILTLSNRPIQAGILENILVNEVLPAAYGIARQQTLHRFGGTYTSIDADTGAKSSITLSADLELGMVVEDWTSEDANFTASLEMLGLVAGPTRLYPAGLSESARTQGQGERIAFRAVLALPFPICISWATVGSFRYAVQPLDLFVFETDGDGNAVSVTNPGLRVTMRRERESLTRPCRAPKYLRTQTSSRFIRRPVGSL